MLRAAKADSSKYYKAGMNEEEGVHVDGLEEPVGVEGRCFARRDARAEGEERE